MSVEIPAAPPESITGWLSEHDVPFIVQEHRTTYTAAETAWSEGVDPREFAKVVGVIGDNERRALIVVDSTDHVDLEKVRVELDAKAIRLLTEDELAELAPDCDVGTIPPLPVYGLLVYADEAVRADPEIVFHAGTHRHTVRVDRAAWERASGVRYADLALAVGTLPPWTT